MFKRFALTLGKSTYTRSQVRYYRISRTMLHEHKSTVGQTENEASVASESTHSHAHQCCCSGGGGHAPPAPAAHSHSHGGGGGCCQSRQKDELEEEEEFEEIDDNPIATAILFYHERLQDNVEASDTVYDISRNFIETIEKNENLANENRVELYNLIIENFAQYDYSVVNVLTKKIETLKGELSSVAISNIIKYNPGRVHSSWELFKNYESSVESVPELELKDKIYSEVLSKLVIGDKAEIQEGENKLDLSKITNCLYILSKISNKEENIPSNVFEILLMKLVKDDMSLYIPIVNPSLESVKLVLSNDLKSESFKLSNIDKFYLWESIKSNPNIEQLASSPEILLDILRSISKLEPFGNKILTTKAETLAEQVELNLPVHDISNTSSELIELVTKLELDNDKAQPKVSSDFRKQILKSVGLYSDKFSLDESLKFYSMYQTKEPNPSFELNDLQSITSMIILHDAVKRMDEKLLEVSEALVPQNPEVPAANLASLILYHGWFGNIDKSLDIYNKSMDMFIKPMEGNETNRGMLIQSLILTCLTGRDLQLAQFIKRKSQDHKLLDSEYDVKINEMFKRYGDIIDELEKSTATKTPEGAPREVAEKDKEAAERAAIEKFRSMTMETIRSLAPN
ncbi:hypothetical protein B5S28_g2617 [[Candida] boidinii]|nr:hypothetical protein B5S28_g2617 [[Candida] boidinii]OWB62696.1 hypothetical protein B5S29_g3637 [[Candida] boidinii]OWB78540.1 hypothetical protein B5S32_g2736 [[Candida] boidinii]